MHYISIDGDDIGRKITSYYLSNDATALRELSTNLEASVEEISDRLTEYGFEVIFSAADGILARSRVAVDFHKLYDELSRLAPKQITFSAGVGESMREAYVALVSAKSNGKKSLHKYSELVIDYKDVQKCIG